ncbi:MAG: DUF3795 domain-containing protein, partial [Firmicutes bacterium]|nr:DUF3795 domain-containing protein [Bacillota bacterium]
IYDLKARGIRRQTCPGCIPRGQHCLHMRDVCDTVGQGRVRFCFECPDFPCPRLQRLDKRYRTKYHMSMIGNLLSMQQNGLDAFLKEQTRVWICKKCGEALRCCHNGLCLSCEADVLQTNKRYRWGEPTDAPASTGQPR